MSYTTYKEKNMLKKLTKIAVASTLALSVHGCFTPPEPIIEPLNKKETVSVIFPDKDPLTKQKFKISKYDIQAKDENGGNVFTEILSSSKYPLADKCLLSIFYPEKYNYPVQLCQGIKKGKYYSFKNVYIKFPNLNTINVIYNHEKSKSQNLLNSYQYIVDYSRITFPIKYKIENNSIIFSYPKSYIIRKSTDDPEKSLPFIDSKQNILQDFDTVFNNIPQHTYYVKRTFILEGSLNSQYPEKAIYANFQRILGVYNNRDKHLYSLKIKEKAVPLRIKVYPYRKGSKVEYLAKIPYKISNKNVTTLTTEDVESIKKRIAQIIND